MTEATELARTAALAADSKKATDVVAFDLTGMSDVCDAIVVCTAPNSHLADSVVDEVEERERTEHGLTPQPLGRRRDRRWVVMDYGSLVVHVFDPEARSFYRIEKLWGDAPRIELGLAL